MWMWRNGLHRPQSFDSDYKVLNIVNSAAIYSMNNQDDKLIDKY